MNHAVIGDALIKKIPDRRCLGPRYTDVLPNYLSKAYAKAGLLSGAYSDLKPDEMPDFKALRSFGAKLYTDAGVPCSVVKKIMAHSRAKMTKQYQDDGYPVEYLMIDGI